MERNEKMPKRVPSERSRMPISQAERKVVEWLREYAWMPEVSESIGKAVLTQLDMLERKKEYMKQEGQQNTEEFERLTVTLGHLEVLYFRWSALMKELSSEK